MELNKLKPQVAYRKLGMPSNVEPERLARPARAGFVWGTIVFAWMLSLLPWKLWLGSPDILIVLIAFWCVHEPSRVDLLTAFGFGVLMDVHEAGPLGEHALSYTLVAYVAVVLHRRLLRFELWSQALHLLPVFFGAKLLTQVIHAWLDGRWAGWEWAVGVALTVVVWPFIGWVLLLPQRAAGAVESSSV